MLGSTSAKSTKRKPHELIACLKRWASSPFLQLRRSCRIFFFFQAEDGIRDYKVTGVQTWLFRSRGERGEVDRHPTAVLVVERAAAGLDHLRELLGHRLPDARDAGERLHAAGAVELLERPTVRLDSLRGL